MAKLWAIIKREYLERVRSKWFLIGTFLGPVFFAAIIIMPAWLASKSTATSDVYNPTILDATGTGFRHRLTDTIAGVTTLCANMPTDSVLSRSTLSPSALSQTIDVLQPAPAAAVKCAAAYERGGRESASAFAAAAALLLLMSACCTFLTSSAP